MINIIDLYIDLPKKSQTKMTVLISFHLETGKQVSYYQDKIRFLLHQFNNIIYNLYSLHISQQNQIRFRSSIQMYTYLSFSQHKTKTNRSNTIK